MSMIHDLIQYWLEYNLNRFQIKLLLCNVIVCFLFMGAFTFEALKVGLWTVIVIVTF